MTTRPTNPAADALINRYFSVHNHGFVALKDYMGTDFCIERAARVSYGLGTRPVSDTTKLIRRLKKDVHTSPFEMVELKFHCAMPIFVARQWIRHRTANVNEYSGRYSKMPNMFYIPKPENICHQDKKNRQGGSEPMDADRVNCFNGYSASSRALAVQNYDWYLENDFSREIARIDLPLSTYTQWYWKIDLHNLMHFLKLRCEPAAQWEIRQYALRMAAIMREVVPIAFDAWENFQLNSMTFSAEEMSQVKATIFETSYVGTSTELIHKITNWKPIEIPPIDSFAVADVGFLEEQWNR